MQDQHTHETVLRLVKPRETLPVRHPCWCEQGDCTTSGLDRTHVGIAEQFLTDYDDAVITLQPGRVDENDGEIGTSFVTFTVRACDREIEPLDIELDAVDLETLVRVAQRQLQQIRGGGSGDFLWRDGRIVGRTGATDAA
jgi:hypothetical protein